MARNDKPWQFKVSFGLVLVVAVLIFGYFYQSYLVVRAAAPVEVAVERIQNRPEDTEVSDVSEAPQQSDP